MEGERGGSAVGDGSLGQDRRPVITDYGTLEALTASHSAVVASQAARFAAGFAGSLSVNPGGGTVGPPGTPGSPGQPGTPGVPLVPPVNGPHSSPGTVVDTIQSGGGPSPSEGNAAVPGGGVSSGGGKTLPFTGLVVITLASIGAAFLSLGAFLRRITRRRQHDAA